MNQENIKSSEEVLERPDEEVQKDLEIARKGHDRRHVLPVNDFVKEAANGMPDEIKHRIMRVDERLEAFGSDIVRNHNVPQNKVDEFIKEELAISAHEARAAFIEEKLQMPNKSYAKQEVMQAINEILAHEPKLEDFKKVARVSFDLNGLKAVNDLAGSRRGDEYLWLVKEVLESEELRQFSAERGFSYVACREGGDEFSAIIKSKGAIKEDDLNDFMVLAKSLLAAKEKAAEILDFNDETILYHYAGFSDKDWVGLTEKKRKEEFEKIKKDIPEGYRFTAQISVEAATAYQGLKDALAKDEMAINEGDSYSAILGKIMGRMFDLSDRRMHEQKNKFKKDLAESDDPDDNMLARIYARTDEEREQKNILEKKNILIVAMKTIDSLKNDLIELYKAQASRETIEVKERDIKAVEDKIKSWE
jgi:GGDEF domain-containing protein